MKKTAWPPPVFPSPRASTHSRAVWRAVGNTEVLLEKERLEGVGRCFAAGARADTVALDAPGVAPLTPQYLTLLDRVVLYAPPAALADRLQVLFDHGASPNAVLSGLGAWLEQFRAAADIDTADALRRDLGRSTHGARVLYGTALGPDYAAPTLLNVLIVGAMAASPVEAPGWVAAVRRALEAGADARGMPDTMSPLAALIEQRHRKNPGAFTALGSMLLEAGASFDEPCFHIAAQPRHFLRGRYSQALPVDLAAYVRDILDPSISFDDDKTTLGALKILLDAHDLTRNMPQSGRKKARARV